VDFYLSIYASEYEENDALLEGSSGELPQVSKETNSQLDQPLQILVIMFFVRTVIALWYPIGPVANYEVKQRDEICNVSSAKML